MPLGVAETCDSLLLEWRRMVRGCALQEADRVQLREGREAVACEQYFAARGVCPTSPLSPLSPAFGPSTPSP